MLISVKLYIRQCLGWSIGFLLAAICFPIWSDEIYIFKPTREKATAVQAIFETECADISISVYGRVKDFVKQVATAKPAGIISLKPIIERQKEYTLSTQGVSSGKVDSKYVFVAVDKAFDISTLDAAKVGVLDILGRKEMKVYLADLFGKKISTKRVTKIDDLLPLLTFNAVDALFIPEQVFEEVKQTSELNLLATETTHKLGLAALAVTDNARSDKLKLCLKNLTPKAKKLLGVDSWK